MNKKQSQMKTMRILMPQWQGGYDESEFPGQIYPLGAKLLTWLAPHSDAPLVEVPVEAPSDTVPGKEGGVFYRQEILRQIKAARYLIDAYAPERVITFGGDCLISQAPFAYLNEYYNGQLGIIWIDAHPDITTPKDFDHAHAMVLGNLLGEGEPLLAQEVKKHYKPEQIVFAGVDNVLPHEQETIKRLGIKTVSSEAMIASSEAVLQWIQAKGFEQVAIHLDLDVLDPRNFYSLLFNNPDVDKPIEAERGKLNIREITRLLKDISDHTNVVGISFAEYMPWDALNLSKMLSQLSFMR